MLEVLHGADGRAVVRPHGELWMATVPALTACVEDLVGTGVRRVVVDLVDVSLLAADGVNAIMRCDDLLRGLDGRLEICNGTGLVRRVVDLTPLQRCVSADSA